MRIIDRYVGGMVDNVKFLYLIKEDKFMTWNRFLVVVRMLDTLQKETKILYDRVSV